MDTIAVNAAIRIQRFWRDKYYWQLVKQHKSIDRVPMSELCRNSKRYQAFCAANTIRVFGKSGKNTALLETDMELDDPIPWYQPKWLLPLNTLKCNRIDLRN